MIETLPSEWTFDEAIENLKEVVKSQGGSSTLVNQQDIVAIVREYRRSCSKDEIEIKLELFLAL